MNMTRSERINTILALRKPRLESVQKAIDCLEGVQCALEELALLLLTVCSDSDQVQKWTSDLEALVSSIVEERNGFETLAERFGRATLNLGISGVSRNGKSTFMRNLTGLGQDLIPTGDMGSCTRVRSTILNRPGRAEAEVTFYSKAELFEEVIRPYFVELKLESPIGYDGFLEYKLPEKPSSDSSKDRNFLQELKEYQKAADSLAAHLNGRTLGVQTQAFCEYILDEKYLEGRTAKWRAVRHARISCEVPTLEAAQMALVDMPGMGDTGLGDERRAMRALACEVDFVIFLKKPMHTGAKIEDWERELWDRANESHPGAGAQHWSFWMFNREAGAKDNRLQCESCLNELSAKHIRVVEAFITDCSQESAVREAIDKMLEHIQAGIGKLDEGLLKFRRDSTAGVIARVQGFVDEIEGKVKRPEGGGNLRQQMRRLAARQRIKLTMGLQKLLKEMEQSRNKDHDGLMDSLQSVIEEARENNGVPSPEKFDGMVAEEGSVDEAYQAAMHHVRAHLRGRFIKLDSVLREACEGMRGRLRDVLVGDGSFEVFVACSTGGAEWWEAVQHYLEGEENKSQADYGRLRRGIQLLREFNLTYRGFAQARLSKHMDPIRPGTPGFKALQMEVDLTQPEETQKEVALERLEELQRKVLYDVENDFESGIGTEPNAALHAVCEEFYEQIIRAEGAAEELELLFESNAEQIWPAELTGLLETIRGWEKWQGGLRDLRGGIEAVVNGI